MTPKEKAEDLYRIMLSNTPNQEFTNARVDLIAKDCALTAVDEIIKVFNPENWGLEMDNAFESIKYWQEVKKEIELL
jgi:hypothetical protein